MINMPTTDMLTLPAGSAEKPDNAGRSTAVEVSFQSIVAADEAATDTQADGLGYLHDVSAEQNKVDHGAIRAIFPAAIAAPDAEVLPQTTMQTTIETDIQADTAPLVEVAVNPEASEPAGVMLQVETVTQREIAPRPDTVFLASQSSTSKQSASVTGLLVGADVQPATRSEAKYFSPSFGAYTNDFGSADSAPILVGANLMPPKVSVTASSPLALTLGALPQTSDLTVPPPTPQTSALQQITAIPVSDAMMNRPTSGQINGPATGQTYTSAPASSLPVANSDAPIQQMPLAQPTDKAISVQQASNGVISESQGPVPNASPRGDTIATGSSTAAAQAVSLPQPPANASPRSGSVRQETQVQPQRNDVPPLQPETPLTAGAQPAVPIPQSSRSSTTERIAAKPDGPSAVVPKTRNRAQYNSVQNAPPVEATATLPPAETVLSEAAETAPFSDVIPLEARGTEPLSIVRQDTNINRPEVMRHVAQQLADVARQSPDRPVELILNPEELGRVRLTFTTTDGGIHIAVMAERGETMDLLRRNIDILAQEYRDMGYRDVNFEFTGSGAGQKDGETDQNGTDQNSNNSDMTDAKNLTPHQLSLEPSIGLDLRL